MTGACPHQGRATAVDMVLATPPAPSLQITIATGLILMNTHKTDMTTRSGIAVFSYELSFLPMPD